MAIDLLQLSFAVGFILALIIYLMAYFSGKKDIKIRSNVLLIGVVVLVVTFFPFQIPWWQLVRLGAVLYVCVLLLSNIFTSVGALLTDVYENSFIPERMRRINQLLYVGALLIFLLFLFFGKETAVVWGYTVFIRVLFACLGLLLALKLLKKD